MMKKEVLMAFAILAATSCSLDDAQYLSRDELGTDRHEWVVNADLGRLEVKVYANRKGQVRVLEGESWLNATTRSFDGDATLCLDYLYNEGFPRLGLVELRTDTRCDTLTVKQEGSLSEELDFSETSVVVLNGNGDTAIPFAGNVTPDAIRCEVKYMDETGWISSFKVTADALCLTTEDNPSATKSRKARLELSYEDGWKNVRRYSILVTQAPSTNVLGELLSFPQVREMATAGGTLITDDYCVEGYVVSRPESGNVGENALLAMNYIDYDAEAQTVYVESTDGRYGFRIRTASAQDNVFRPDTYVRILLGGATVSREENPERYSIYGITEEMVLEAKSGTVPAKVKKMSELTDADVYTYVTLEDCEIPVRKGGLTPVNEGYTRLFGSDRVSKFPIVIRDKEGSSMYLYTNTTCPYRRDGRRLPYGKGSISGVVVHENYRSYVDMDAEDEDLCGNIGRYQLRHMRYEDIALEDDIESSFSALLTEYRYLNLPGENPDHVWLPTYGDNGYFTHSYTSYVNASTHAHAWASSDFTYLGPCGNSFKSNVNGFGIILEDGTDYGSGCVANETGKGVSSAALGMAWANSNWWNSGKGEAWIVVFSTKGIVSDVLSMQLSTQNISQSLRTPRYWKAEWSLDGVSWKKIASYVVPDVGINSNTLPGQCLGFKQMDFKLPLEMLGHEKVYVRLAPEKNAASSGNDYASSTIKNGNANAINYFAIRYNK